MNLDKRRNPLIQEAKRAFFGGINRGPNDTARQWIASEYEFGNPWSLVFAPTPAVTPDEEKQAVKILNRLARFDLPVPPTMWFVFSVMQYDGGDMAEFDGPNAKEEAYAHCLDQRKSGYDEVWIIEGRNWS